MNLLQQKNKGLAIALATNIGPGTVAQAVKPFVFYQISEETRFHYLHLAFSYAQCQVSRVWHLTDVIGWLESSIIIDHTTTLMHTIGTVPGQTSGRAVNMDGHDFVT